MKISGEKVFKDPVHGYITVEDRVIWDLIQTREFQRLRRIKQLGGTFMAFHGAEHSRFSHSLGVYLIAKRMIERLAKGGTPFTEEERLLTLCAALLHDLGHGPFSHSFEEVLEIPHETFTARILTEKTEVHHILESHHIGFSEKIKQIITREYENPIIVSLISSQLDADRLDYLVRDAYFSGTTYGEIDVQRILRTLRVVDGQLVYKLSGMHAIEDYLLSRYQMYWQIYLHPVARSFDIIVQGFFKRIRKLLEQNYPFKSDVSLFKALFGEKHPDIFVYLKIDDTTVLFTAQNLCDEDDPIVSDLANRLLNRRLFKEFYYTPGPVMKQVLHEIKENMLKLGFDPAYYYCPDYQFKVPYDYYGDDKISDGINLLMRDGSIQEISRVSDVISGITGKPKKDYKLYIPMETIQRMEDSEPKSRILQLLKSLNRG